MWGKFCVPVVAFAVAFGVGLETLAQTKATPSTRSSKPVATARPAATNCAVPAAKVRSRVPVRAAGCQVAYQQAYAAPENRRPTRYGQRPSASRPPASTRPPPASSGASRTLSFYNLHTGQSLTVTYWRGGRYVPGELARLNAFLRDPRDGDQMRMDPALFDILWQVRRSLRSTQPYRVVSGYRSPETNAWLASVSSGVASNSMHMRGKAMDVMLADRSAAQIRQAARALRRGGVGYYPYSGFVHIDTGPVRYW